MMILVLSKMHVHVHGHDETWDLIGAHYTYNKLGSNCIFVFWNTDTNTLMWFKILAPNPLQTVPIWVCLFLSHSLYYWSFTNLLSFLQPLPVTASFGIRPRAQCLSWIFWRRPFQVSCIISSWQLETAVMMHLSSSSWSTSLHPCTMHSAALTPSVVTGAIAMVEATARTKTKTKVSSFISPHLL